MSEKNSVRIIAFLFGALILGSWIFGVSHGGSHNALYYIAGVVGTVVYVYATYSAFKSFDNPNRDYWRWVLIIASLLASIPLLIMGSGSRFTDFFN